MRERAIQRGEASTTLDALKVFPLPGAVLLPGAQLPLHVFEPRYRAMIRDALATDELIAICNIDPMEADGPHGPTLPLIAGVGRIVDYTRMEDGRYMIVLGGLARVRIRGELDVMTDYRQVSAEIITEEPTESATARRTIDSIRMLLMQLASLGVPDAAVLIDQLDEEPTAAGVADMVAAAAFEDAAQSQQLLEELDVMRRLDRVETRLAELVASAHTPADTARPN